MNTPHPNHRPLLFVLFVLLIMMGGIGVYYGIKGLKKTPYKVSIIVKSDNDSMGTVLGSGSYPQTDTITIKALSYQDYRFVKWNDGNTDSIRTVVADHDQEFIAFFKEKPKPRPVSRFEITVLSNNPAWGTVTGGNNTYDSLAVVTIKACPKDGYKFVSWEDGVTNDQRIITVKQNQTFKAIFERVPAPRVGSGNQQLTFNLGWGSYEGPMKDGKPDGRPGKVTVTRTYDIIDASGNTITVYSGETITTKFDNGLLISGEIHRKDGSHLLFQAKTD